MSKTQSFNCAVRLGDKNYPAGEPVPVGGRNGLPDDEVKRLAENFGLWRGAPAPAAGADASAEIAKLQAAKAELSGHLDAAKKELEQASAANAELSGKLDVANKELDQALKDNEVLAARVGELEKAGK